MISVPSLQFFLNTSRDEKEIISLITKETGIIFGSLEFNAERCVGIVDANLYEDGYQQGFLMNWPEREKIQISGELLAERIANVLSVDVLMEIGPEDDDWILARPGKSLEKVTIEYLDDGVDVKQILKKIGVRLSK